MRTLPLCLLTISVSTWPHMAVADPIRIVGDFRSVAAQAITFDPEETTVTQSKFAANDLAASANIIKFGRGARAQTAATLSSSVNPRGIFGIFGSGTVFARATVLPSAPEDFLATAGGVSEFLMDFQLDRATAFEFIAVFSGTSEGTSEIVSLAALFQPGNVLFRSPVLSTGTILESGLLPAGVSTLRVQERVVARAETAGETFTGRGSFGFALNLTTPEPASIVLLGSGVLGLFGMRHRQSARP